MNKYFTCLFLVVFSLGVGAFWEILEYSCDGIFHTNAQQYMASTKGTLVSKNDIPLKGHEALKDTMKDLMVNFVGAAFFCSICYISLTRQNKYKNIITNLTPKKGNY